MGIKRTPLGRDPLEWIKVTKPDGEDETDGTATDRLTQGASPTEGAKPSPPATPAEGPPEPTKTEPQAPAPPAAPPAEEPPVTITSTTATLQPEEAEQHLNVATEKAETPKPGEIPLFAQLEAQEKKPAPQAPPAEPPEKPTGRPLGLEEVPPTEVEGDAAALEKAATTPPTGVQMTEQAGHSVNFMAPGIGKAETVSASAPESEEEKAEEPVVSVPSELETPKAEEVSTACAPPPAAPAEAPQEPERVHVGAVDLRVERRPIPVPPAAKSEQKEQPVSFAIILVEVLMLLMIVFVLYAFFANRGQVNKALRELRGSKQQAQQMPRAADIETPRR